MPRRARRPLCVLLLQVGAIACSAAPPMPDPAPPHPAAPQTNEAPRPAPSTTLEMPERRATPPSKTGRGH